MLEKSLSHDEVRKRLSFSHEEQLEIEEEVNYLCILQELNDYKEAQGITNAEISKRTGISRPELTLIFTGRRNVTIETLSRIAHAFNMVVKVKLEMAK